MKELDKKLEEKEQKFIRERQGKECLIISLEK
jgi:hypothetical protein